MQNNSNTIRYYTDDQAQYIHSKVPEIEAKAITYKRKHLEPTLDELTKVQSIVLDYIREKKRKIYGGYALNTFFKNIDPSLAIYKDFDFPDIELYSPEPLIDLVYLCNKLHEMGFKYVQGREAQHAETYTVFVNFEKIVDISYVPKNVYNYIRTVELNGIQYTHMHFMLIDYFRMINDPLGSYWRLEKAFVRMNKIQKYFPLPLIKGKIVSDKLNDTVKNILLDIKTKFLNNEAYYKSMIVSGYEAYNYYVGVSESKNSKNMLVNVPFLEFMSTNYVRDVVDLFNFIKSRLPDEQQSKLIHEEYYPFFQLTGYKSIIKYDGQIVAIVFHNNGMCIPYQKIQLKYRDNSILNHQFVTFSYLVLMLMINEVRARIDKNKVASSNYKIMLSNVLTLRNEYLANKKKSVLDETPFREYQIQCIGTQITQDRLFRLKMMKRRAVGKYSYSYDPSTSKEKSPPTNYIFSNTSGNIIRNEHNKKVNVYKSSNEQNNDIDVEDDVDAENADDNETNEETDN
jgi:hypothetical protein